MGLLSKKPLRRIIIAGIGLSIQLKHNTDEPLTNSVTSFLASLLKKQLPAFAKDCMASFNKAQAFVGFAWRNSVPDGVLVGKIGDFIEQPASVFICQQLSRRLSG